MIKVCHFTCGHAAEDTRVFKKECVSLAKNGYDVTLVTTCGESYEKNGVKIVGYNLENRSHFSRLSRILKYSRRAYLLAKQADADIYHFHDPELLPYGYKLKKAGKVVVFDSHENTAESIKEKTELPLFIRKVLYRLFSRYQQRVCKKLDGLIYVSPNFQKFFDKICPRTELITNYPILSESFRQALPKEFKLFFAGNISDQWSQKQIIEALDHVEKAGYILCGELFGDCVRIVEENTLPGKIDYRGVVDHLEVQRLMRESSVGMALLQPSDNTDWNTGTMGNTKIFEQMMNGLPIICTHFDLWKEFVNKYQCGICVDPNNVEEITNALNYFLNNPNECSRMGLNARKAAEEEFNWSTQEEKLLSLYKDLEKTIC